MISKKEISKAFKLLNLSNKNKRNKILSQGATKKEAEDNAISYRCVDNTVKQKEGSEDAKLE